MLKKMRYRFMAVIMAVAAVSIVALLSINLTATKRTMEQRSIHTLETVLDSAGFLFKPGETIQSPYFIVDVTATGNVSVERSDYYTLDDDLLLDIVSQAYYSENTTGTVKDYSLRYMAETQFGMTRIAFVDTSVDDNTLKSMSMSSLIIGLVAFGIFFVFSALVSKAIVKPTAKAWENQKQFIADASHELKTPLTVIMANSELLNSSAEIDGEEDKRHIDNILAEGSRMKLLLEDLLEQARADDTARHYGDIGETVDLSFMAEECALSFEPVIYENNRTISTEVDEGIEVCGNPDKLRRVITILIDNANKYSDEGTNILVSLHTDKKNAVLKVSDTGQPISQEQLGNLFLRFYRADEARSHNGSYGLGLSIAKSIVESHNGTISAQCSGKEAVFTIVLPLRKGKGANTEKREPENEFKT